MFKEGLVLLALTVAACNSADSKAPEKIDVVPPTVGPQINRRWPERDIKIIGSLVNCDKSESPRKDEDFLYPDEQANIKGFLIRAGNPGRIAEYSGGIVINNTETETKTIMDVTMSKFDINITAEAIRPRNSKPATFITAKFTCTQTAGPVIQ